MSIDCLRVSVTDRCNLRCVYCRPLPDCGLMPVKVNYTKSNLLKEEFSMCKIGG